MEKIKIVIEMMTNVSFLKLSKKSVYTDISLSLSRRTFTGFFIE